MISLQSFPLWRSLLSDCDLARAIALLKEQYAVGTVEVRIVQFKA